MYQYLCTFINFVGLVALRLVSGRHFGSFTSFYLPAKSSSSGIGSTELLNSNIEPRRPIKGFLLLVLAVLLPLPLSISVGWLTPTPCSIRRTPGEFSLFASTESDDSELALDLNPLTDPELSLRNNPITDAVLGWSKPPLQTKPHALENQAKKKKNKLNLLA